MPGLALLPFRFDAGRTDCDAAGVMCDRFALGGAIDREVVMQELPKASAAMVIP
jgi:hypothetical protein